MKYLLDNPNVVFLSPASSETSTAVVGGTSGMGKMTQADLQAKEKEVIALLRAPRQPLLVLVDELWVENKPD